MVGYDFKDFFFLLFLVLMENRLRIFWLVYEHNKNKTTF